MNTIKISARQKSYLLIIILIVGAILRFHNINQPFIDTISWRQASTAMMADNFYRTNWNIFYPEISWNGPGPSYNGREFQTVSYIAALLYTVFGQHDWIGRSISVIFGLWGIFALYKLINCVWNQEYALMGAMVMAILPGSIYIDREFLPDPAMVALVTTSCWLFIVYCQTEKLKYLILATLIGTWGFLTKITGLIITIPMLYALFTIMSLQQVKQPRKILVIGITTIISLTTVINYYLWARYLSLNYPPYHFAGAGSWIWDQGLAKWLGEQYYLGKLYQNFNGWIWTKPIILLVLFGLLIPPPSSNNDIDKNDDNRQIIQGQPIWLFHWWLLGFSLYYLIGAKHLVDQSYNFHLINPPAAALAGLAIVKIANFAYQIGRSPAYIAVIMTIFLIIGSVGHHNLKQIYYPYAEQSYHMGLALSQVSVPGDLVVTIPNDIGNPIPIYYSQRRGWIFPPAWSTIPWWDDLPPGQDEGLINLLNELQDRGADWFGIVAEQHQKIWQSNPVFAKYVEKNYQLVKESPDWLIYRINSNNDK